MKLAVGVVIALISGYVTSARAEWESQSLTTPKGKPLYNMVLSGDLVMNDKFAGAQLYLQCLDGVPLMTIFTIQPFFKETSATVQYWLDTQKHSPEEWVVTSDRKAIGIGDAQATAFMRSLIGHQRLRVLIPIQDAERGFATFSLGNVRPAVEAVARKCGWEL